MLRMIHLIGSILFFLSNYLIRLFCELRSLLSELLLVNSCLIDLCLRFLLFGVEIGDFISEEFVVSLLSVGVLARNQKPNQTRPGEQKAGDWKPNELVCFDDSETVYSPEHHAVSGVEGDKNQAYLKPAQWSVFVLTLVVGFIDRVIPVTVPAEFGSSSFRSFFLFRSLFILKWNELNSFWFSFFFHLTINFNYFKRVCRLIKKLNSQKDLTISLRIN